MNMFDKRFHIFDIHLSIRIESDEPLYFQFIAISFDEIISGLIRSTASSIDRMVKNNDKRIRILLFFVFKDIQGIVSWSIIDKD